MKVLKFGGYAIDSAENILKVKEIIRIANRACSYCCISVSWHNRSSCLNLSRLAASRDKNFFRLHNEIETRHMEIINSLFEEPLRIRSIEPD